MKKGLTLIELLIVLAIISIFILGAIFAYRPQLAKGRDAKRKADLNKMQKLLEDYYNDSSRYPTAGELADASNIVCNQPFSPYASQVPCDPIDSSEYHYYYETGDSRQYYIIYTKLENENDPAIAEVGCAAGCGPTCEYNYGVASQNASLLACSGAWYICQGSAPGMCNDAAGSEICPGPGCYLDDVCCGGSCCGPGTCAANPYSCP
jgi:prepilin-type N-terminal cleavage/methylation domain-containing protein